MGIDPMFNLGKFYVTVTTFTYSHVINKSTSKSPTFLAHNKAQYMSREYLMQQNTRSLISTSLKRGAAHPPSIAQIFFDVVSKNHENALMF